MKKVLVRFYNKNNLGDDLFVHILTSRYLNQFSTVLQLKNTGIESISNMRIFKLRIVDSLFYRFERIFRIKNILITLLSNRNDILIYIGGSIFIEDNQMQEWKREKGFYRRLKIPYYIIGSNIGPYKSDLFIPIVKCILTGAKDVCLRDQSSYKLVEDLPNVRVSTDIAFALNTKPYNIVKDKIAIFSLIDGTKKFDSITTSEYEGSVRTLTVQLLKKGYRVIYMSFCEYEGDEIANKRIRAELPVEMYSMVEEFKYRGNLDDALSLLAASEIIVASRFHATILGMVFGKKVLPLAYSNKTTDILADMGFPGTVVDIRKINQFDPIAFDFNKIPKIDITEQRILAETQFQELDKVLVKRIADA